MPTSVSGPFERHLRDAIALNETRAPLYAGLSDGASLPISRRLIRLERALLPVARWFDRRAAPYHRAGIPLLDPLFAPMTDAAPFRAEPTLARPGSETSSGPAIRSGTIRRRVQGAYGIQGFPAVAYALAAELTALGDAAGTECLARHILESAHRLAILAPDQIRLAESRGIASPRWILWLLLRLHLWGLGQASVLDARARPLQARGISILADDLPPLPANETLASLHRLESS